MPAAAPAGAVRSRIRPGQPPAGAARRRQRRGAVYRALRGLEKQGLVRSTWRTSEAGPARRTYQVTPLGMATLDRQAAILEVTHRTQNILPLINNAKASDAVREALNAVSAKLTTQGLIDLNRKLSAPDKPNPSTVAKEWLSATGLG